MATRTKAPAAAASVKATAAKAAPTKASAAKASTAVDAPDGHFALAVFALSFHHLPPATAAAVLAEGTRVADKLLIIDLPRPPAPLHLLRLATMLPLAPFTWKDQSIWHRPFSGGSDGTEPFLASVAHLDDLLGLAEVGITQLRVAQEAAISR